MTEIIDVDFKWKPPDPDDDEPSMRIKSRWQSERDAGCHHLSVVIDERLRRVECKKCGVELEPMEVILDEEGIDQEFRP